MKEYTSPKVEVITFDNEIYSAADSKTCNCSAIQYDNDTSLLEGCDARTYGFVEIGDHY